MFDIGDQTADTAFGSAMGNLTGLAEEAPSRGASCPDRKQIQEPPKNPKGLPKGSVFDVCFVCLTIAGAQEDVEVAASVWGLGRASWD